jgi:uncharacterized membrane protein YkoI
VKLTKKLAVVAALAGVVGFAGINQVVSAQSVQTPSAITAQQRSNETAEPNEGTGENETANEQQETAQLQALAKITPQQAQQAAQAAQPGQVTGVQLEDENGSLVYAVKIGQNEVKVDAGNGKILYTETPNSEQNEGNRPRGSIQVPQSGNEANESGETNDGGK